MQISDIKDLLKTKKLDAYLINRGNVFINSDILPQENIINKLTGFTGSNATLIVCQKDCYLFTDSRYELQAPIETKGKKIKVICGYFLDWLKEQKEDFKLGINPWTLSIDTFNKIKKRAPQIQIVKSDLLNIGSNICKKTFNVFEHQTKFCGIKSKEKIKQIRTFIEEKNLDALLLCSPESVSWLLNIRSNCLPCTPVVRAFALITKQGKTQTFAQNLKNLDYADFKDLPQALEKFTNIGIDEKQTPLFISDFIGRYKRISDPVMDLKAVKNNTELKGFRACHIEDGVAVTKLLYWLKHSWQNKTELDVVKKLFSLRQQGKLFFSNSFETIAGFGPNGAIVHYSPSIKSNKKLGNGLVLIDSGGQYFNGTTDVTRTICLGKPTKEQIQCFTAVLKAHIALSSAYFPQGTQAGKLESLSKSQLWKIGKNYMHGTGHGVGHFSVIHENPPSISSSKNLQPLKEGMVTSIEPGYYKESKFGIRIENLVEICKCSQSFEFEMLKFEPLTLVPIDKELIDAYLLSKEEKAWLNEYHKKVFAKISKRLSKEERSWLADACSPI